MCVSMYVCSCMCVMRVCCVCVYVRYVCILSVQLVVFVFFIYIYSLSTENWKLLEIEAFGASHDRDWTQCTKLAWIFSTTGLGTTCKVEVEGGSQGKDSIPVGLHHAWFPSSPKSPGDRVHDRVQLEVWYACMLCIHVCVCCMYVFIVCM